MNVRLLLVAIVILGLSSCATRRAPSENVIVDTKGVDMATYQTDLAECSAYAEQVRVGREAGEGAVEGAVVGGAVGAVIRGHEGAEKGAAIGGISGGARGARSAAQERDMVMRRCLSGRGYRVLN
jgi:outer membrane lipoprotein SlyB